MERRVSSLPKRLLKRLDHDDIIAEIEERNKEGEGIQLWSFENGYWFGGFTCVGGV